MTKIKLPKLNKKEKDTCYTIGGVIGAVGSERGFYSDAKVKMTKEINDSGYKSWSFIPNNHSHKTICSVIKAIRKTDVDHPSFIDLGCGVGNILAIASTLGCGVRGVELDTDVPKVFHSHAIFNADILKYDITEYNPDIVYMYMPIQDTKMMQKVFNKTAKNMKAGSYLIFVTDGSTILTKPNLKVLHEKDLVMPKELMPTDNYTVFYKPHIKQS